VSRVEQSLIERLDHQRLSVELHLKTRLASKRPLDRARR
jgi:hypothetical protein